MSASAFFFKKEAAKKTSEDQHIKSDSGAYRDNSSTAQLQSFQNLADKFVNGESQEKIVQLKNKENKTGLPDHIKNGVEQLSGHSLDDVKVHYNSDKPAQLKAHAYAEGNQIHVASGQEQYLSHEAWHVVQQKENRVSPTKQLNGVQVNDDPSLEKEADVMGAKAASGNYSQTPNIQLKSVAATRTSLQGILQREPEEEKKEGEKSDKETLLDKVAPATTELQDLNSDGNDIYKTVQSLEDPGKEPESVTETLMNKVRGVTSGVNQGIFKTIASLASPIFKIIGGVSVGYQKWNAWTNLKDLGEKQEKSGGAKDEKIPYTIKKLAKGFLVAVNNIVQGIIELVKNILIIAPEGLSKAAALGLSIYGAIITGLNKLYSVPKRWYQLWKGDSNQKDINSQKVTTDAFNGDDNAIDFIWALGLPSIKGSGFESLDSLKNSMEVFKNQATNAIKGGINSATGTNLEKKEDPENIAKKIAESIKAGGGDGKKAFKDLIKNKKLNSSSKEKIQKEVKDAMTGFGT